MSERTTCSICPNGSVQMRKDCLGRIHRACVEHIPYLEGWVRDVQHEVDSDSAASAHYERAAYGDRD